MLLCDCSLDDELQDNDEDVAAEIFLIALAKLRPRLLIIYVVGEGRGKIQMES